MNTIFVSVRPEETRMGTVEDDQLRDYAVERNSADNLVGNVYRARVCNVVPGIQAAFVDLNTGKNGFLTLKKGETLSEGQMLLVQVVKHARGSKGPAVTRDITLPGRYVVLECCSDQQQLKSIRRRIQGQMKGLDASACKVQARIRVLGRLKARFEPEKKRKAA